MTWSTRELADLAGTTVNTVRHYHARGILEPPERRYNGYKQYEVHHLVRLLQVRRIVELGVPLARVEAVGNDSTALLGELQQLETQLAIEVERLRRTRSDIAVVLRVHAPVDTPRGFEDVAVGLSRADLSLIHILAKLCGEGEAAALRNMIAAEPAQLRDDFDPLPAEASEAVRQDVADRMLATGAHWRSPDCPWAGDEPRRQARGPRVHRATIVEAVNELYNPAQRDVLHRVTAAASESLLSRQTPEARPHKDDLLLSA